ncbi:histidine triad (HIT) protein [Desulfovibrio sp. X2]|uniref:HIT family protein n=1 Tax=Desulfovibrio sp. X2 TaxID=941449 RepID=UPI0003588618|nr:HIT domain-containing protein [Desulfovibrio sp. X2]EPR42295.1 histidine triad (HIT) protein [Desulfovibrio sp. X2]
MSRQVLWAPWRLDYILGPKPDTCVFCLPETTEEDEERLVLHRGESAYVIMNKFPYNNGHLMVAPYRHVSCLTDLTEDESFEVMSLVRRCVGVLRKAFNPHGINAGFNLGEAAGAGIAAHLHFQIVPRWNGDNSFMAVFGETSVIPEHLRSTYTRLRPLFVG